MPENVRPTVAVATTVAVWGARSRIASEIVSTWEGDP